ncbi:MAG TPA: hypothetical protein VFA20_29985 [Myxococcaceae bacterium]|nr:hypothetical protein [Myxococcaceae bacterium]
MAIPPVSSNPNNGNLEKAVQGDTTVSATTTSSTVSDAAGKGGGVRTGDISFFEDPSKKLPINDDLFE